MSSKNFDRRDILGRSLVLGAAAGVAVATTARAQDTSSSVTGPALSKSDYIDDYHPKISPIRARANRIFSTTVCLRPVRAQGPRIEAERIGETLVVHNYGHAGNGWSLSWGSANLAIQTALGSGPTKIAVIGCGIIGLTSAIIAQRAGMEVTIYARDLLPQTRSSRAQAFWGPGGGGVLKGLKGTVSVDQWEQMVRFSFTTYRQYMGFAGRPIEWRDQYTLSDVPFDQMRKESEEKEKAAKVRYENYGSRIADLAPRGEELPEGATPFPAKYVRRSESLVFNIPEYSHMLMQDFFATGGKFVRKVFHAPSDLTELPEKVVINCPGFAAREWWNDKSVTPMRGQIAWLLPQEDVNYGLSYNGILVTSRRDGIAVQGHFGGENTGYNDSNEVADRTEAERAVGMLGDIYSTFRR